VHSPDDHPKEACGVFGIYAPGEDVARLTFFGLYALQHRGQESAGIAAGDGERIAVSTGMGLVSQVFTEDALTGLTGFVATGHTRYSTTGGSTACNAQPIIVQDPDRGPLALAHNGNLTNAAVLRDDLESQGIVFETTADSETMAHLLALAPAGTWQDRFHYMMRRVEGAYSLTVMTKDTLFAVRDPLGVRPLCLGRLSDGWIVASESCALEHLGATFERDVEPGEVVQIDATGMRSFFPMPPAAKRAGCTFEHTYFARPDSRIDGHLVYPTRERLGQELAREHPADADLVIGVPDSAIPAAIGYAREAGLPFREGLIRNRYVGRTFIQPDQRLREAGARLKYNPLPDVLDGQRVIMIDDSIVRGTTTPHVVALLRRAGAREVHMRVAIPPIVSPCFFGVDMARSWELLAVRKSIDEIREHIGADSLGYLSLEGMMRAIGENEKTLCNGCFTGRYPVNVQLHLDRSRTIISESELEPELAGAGTAVRA
jgi:amidophosphoribosyltransferase